MIFDNEQSAIGTQQSAKESIATLCRPNSKNEKRRPKLGQIGPLKNAKKGFDRSVDRAVELGLSLCFQQSV
jgi:hypothetical protein